MLSVIAAIRDAALQNPNHPAYETNNESITYGELWDYSDCLAHHLMALKLTRQQPIIVYGHMSPLQLVAFF